MNISSVSNAQERRRQHRAAVDWPVLIQDTKGGIVAEMENISTSGALIRCSMPLKPQEKFKLHIIVPNHSPLIARAKVAWLSVNCTENGVFPCGMGIRFTRVARRDREFLSSLVSGSREEVIATSLAGKEKPIGVMT